MDQAVQFPPYIDMIVIHTLFLPFLNLHVELCIVYQKNMWSYVLEIGHQAIGMMGRVQMLIYSQY